MYTTEQTGKGAPFTWGPHKTSKLPYSAAGTIIFTIHSLEILRPFVPDVPEAKLPTWWLAWRYHVLQARPTSILTPARTCHHAIESTGQVTALMKYSFTFAELVSLEGLIELEHTASFATPEYKDTWIPKMHWQTHTALDIYRWGNKITLNQSG